MRNLFVRNIAISAAAHVLIVAALFVVSFFSFRASRPAREITTFIDFAVVPAVEAPAPSPVAEPAPSPVEAPAPERKPVAVSRKVVTREPAATRQEMTAEQIRKMLGAGEPQAPRTVESDAFDKYLVYVRDVMYGAWRQPVGLSGVGSPVVRVRLRVQGDGRITRREIVRSSGNEEIDRSVMAALESVDRLRPLPPGRGAHEDITINFELTRGQAP